MATADERLQFERKGNVKSVCRLQVSSVPNEYWTLVILDHEGTMGTELKNSLEKGPISVTAGVNCHERVILAGEEKALFAFFLLLSCRIPCFVSGVGNSSFLRFGKRGRKSRTVRPRNNWAGDDFARKWWCITYGQNIDRSTFLVQLLHIIYGSLSLTTWLGVCGRWESVLENPLFGEVSKALHVIWGHHQKRLQ